jgi:hypothetical protein
MQTLETKEISGYTVKICVDPEPLNPRDNNVNFGTIFHVVRDYDLGERKTLEEIQEIINDKSIISLPVYLLDHSGISISTFSFMDQWDSGQVGVISVSKAKVLKDFNRKKWSKKLEKRAIEIMKNEIIEFDAYLQGNMYCYLVEKDGVVIDSCSSFFDYDECMSQGVDTVDAQVIQDRKIDQLLTA